MQDENGFEIHMTAQERSLNRVMNSFANIDLDQDGYFKDIPLIDQIEDENSYKIAILVNNSLDVAQFEKWPYVDTQFAKFENIYKKSGDNLLQILNNFQRNSGNEDFIKFLRDNIADDIDLDNQEDVWREIISCVIVYSLNDEKQQDFIGPYLKQAITYSSVKEYFGNRN